MRREGANDGQKEGSEMSARRISWLGDGGDDAGELRLERAFSRVDLLRPRRVQVAPCMAKRRAIERPMPLDAPVMRACRPAREGVAGPVL